ncbi:uncharacterized protein MELLADRAFT_109816 [Melampsora larici-populina 98AG31]|uniref:Secreted protein n=1 Tax=Melampsora larici-populina (strain 98AG31 / pathotype 3-4-7) TaxID=747676 RepID=F4RXQ7_MELLP|nr:uncharacterized protein MELLADRAFT_109816 [Melampsora larici-populina 98AG31]EGG02771.1 hypothetical protein MELLADRAFT_109816 [Melampsora larici-populina 98AG31]
MDLIHFLKTTWQLLLYLFLLLSECSGNIINKLHSVAEKNSDSGSTDNCSHILNASAADFKSSQSVSRNQYRTLVKNSKAFPSSVAKSMSTLESTNRGTGTTSQVGRKKQSRIQSGGPYQYVVDDGIQSKNYFENYHKGQRLKTPSQNNIQHSIIHPAAPDSTLRHLPLPNFFIPYLVPCFFNPEDAAKWSSMGMVFNPMTSTVVQPQSFGTADTKDSHPHLPTQQDHEVHNFYNYNSVPTSQSSLLNPGITPEAPSIPGTFLPDDEQNVSFMRSNAPLRTDSFGTFEPMNIRGRLGKSSSPNKVPNQKDFEPNFLQNFPKLSKVSIQKKTTSLETPLPLSTSSEKKGNPEILSKKSSPSHTNVSWKNVAEKKSISLYLSNRAGLEDLPGSGHSKILHRSSRRQKANTQKSVQSMSHQKNQSSSFEDEIKTPPSFIFDQEAQVSSVSPNSMMKEPNSMTYSDNNTPKKLVEISKPDEWSISLGNKKRGKSFAQGKTDSLHFTNPQNMEIEWQASKLGDIHSTVDGAASANVDFPKDLSAGEINHSSCKVFYPHVLPNKNVEPITHDPMLHMHYPCKTSLENNGVISEDQEYSGKLIPGSIQGSIILESQESKLEKVSEGTGCIPELFNSLPHKPSTESESPSSRNDILKAPSQNEDHSSSTVSDEEEASKTTFIHQDKLKKKSKKQSKKQSKNKRISKKFKDVCNSNVENSLPVQTSSILQSSLGKLVQEVLQIKIKSKKFEVELDDEMYKKIDEEYNKHSTTSVTHADIPTQFFEIFRELSEVYEEVDYISKRMTAFIVQFTEKALVSRLSAMKTEVSPLSKELLDLLKVEEEFPTFADIDKSTFKKAQGISQVLETLEDIGFATASSEFDLDSRFEQMMIMSHIDKRAIIITQEKMKLFMKQGGKLSVVMEISHCLGFGMEEAEWSKMNDDQIRERVKNIVFAMHGRYLIEDELEKLSQMRNTWYDGRERDFMLNEPELSKIFKRRFALLVCDAEKLPLKGLSDWFHEKEMVKNVQLHNKGITFGQVLVGAHYGIPLLNLQNFLGLIHHKKYSTIIKPRKQFIGSVYVSKGIHLEGVTTQFENLKQFFKIYDKKLFIDNTNSITDSTNYVVEFELLLNPRPVKHATLLTLQKVKATEMATAFHAFTLNTFAYEIDQFET